MPSLCPAPGSTRRATILGYQRFINGPAVDVPAAERAKLDQVAAAIRASFGKGCAPVADVTVVGHSDRDRQNRGAAYEMKLSVERANRVRADLQAKLEPRMVQAIRWTVQGVGATAPVVANPRDESERYRNRRVELVYMTSRSAAIPVPLPGPTATRWRGILGPLVRAGNAVEAQVDGAETFRAFFNAIRTARSEGHYCYLLGWWLDDDEPLIPPAPGSPPPKPGSPDPTSIRSLFADLSQKGVQVRAMLWDQWGRQNTAEVKRIDALPRGGAILDNETLTYGSHHQKVLIVKGDDGLIAFCGGVDINGDRIRPRPSSGSGSSSGTAGGPLHDVHCRITGPGAHDLLQTFVQRWTAHPDAPKIDAVKGPLLGLKEPVPKPAGSAFVRIGRTLNFTRPHKCARERTVRDIMHHAIDAARRFIYIEDQYLVSMEAAGLLAAALPRIQHLTILIPDSPITSVPQIWRRRKDFIDALRSGPHAAKVRVAVLAPPGNPHTYVHAKTWVIDDELAVIGSANCNRRGWSYDSEVIAAIFDRTPAATGTPSFAQALRMRLWAEHLRVAPATVRDGLASAGLWVRPPAGARIRPYNPTAGTSVTGLAADYAWNSVVDPSADALPVCPAASAAPVTREWVASAVR